MKILISLIMVLMATYSFAGSSEQFDLSFKDANLKLKKTFSVYGQVTQTKYRPINSPISFQYDVVYYIPAKLKGQNNLNTLVFLHGGGQSTMTPEGSLRVTNMYMNDLKTVADNLGIILIMPSGSGNNWGGHMLSMLRDLNQTIRAELPVNPNKIALSGHSMGGMGITRSAHWLADDYAFFLPTAAGMDEKHQTERNLRPYFNMKYYHMQGLNDHFQVFITRCENHQKAIDALERRYNAQTGFELEFYQGTHNYPKAKYQNRLAMLFKTESRNLYQEDLYGMLYDRSEVRQLDRNNNQKWYLKYPDKYFWLKALEFDKQQSAPVVLVDAKIRGNEINIKIDSGVKKLRVYLTNKLMNLKQAISIKINGKVKFNSLVDLSLNTNAEMKKDPGFKFDSYVDLAL